MATTSGTTYTSQQPAIMAAMTSYLQNPSNWLGGVPLLTDLNPGSVIYTLLSAVSVAVDTLGAAIAITRLAAYISTATGSDLDAKVGDFGLTRNAAVAANGDFTFARNNPASVDVAIPAGSLVSTVPTSAAPATVYATQADATLPAGQTSVDVFALCQVTGISGNVSEGTQLLIASAIPGIDNVTLGVTISNGSDEETDDSLRARGLAAFVALAHGTVASYEQIALSVAGVESAIVVPQDRGPGTVDIYILGPGSSIPSPDLQVEVQNVVDEQKVATDDVRVLIPDDVIITATLTVHPQIGYDAAAVVTATQAAVSQYIEDLGIGGGAPGAVYASQLVAAALTVTGVVDATTSFISQPVLAHQVPRAGIITVNVA